MPLSTTVPNLTFNPQLTGVLLRRHSTEELGSRDVETEEDCEWTNLTFSYAKFVPGSRAAAKAVAEQQDLTICDALDLTQTHLLCSFSAQPFLLINTYTVVSPMIALVGALPVSPEPS